MGTTRINTRSFGTISANSHDCPRDSTWTAPTGDWQRRSRPRDRGADGYCDPRGSLYIDCAKPTDSSYPGVEIREIHRSLLRAKRCWALRSYPVRVSRMIRRACRDSFAMNVTFVKAVVALVPTGIIFSGSVILFFRRKAVCNFPTACWRWMPRVGRSCSCMRSTWLVSVDALGPSGQPWSLS